MPLTDMKARTAKPRDKRYSMADTDTLYLEIMPTGKKIWRLRYLKEGKRNWHTIGEYPAIGLQEARDRKNILRQKIRDGEPLTPKRNKETFGAIAAEWADAHDLKIANLNDRIKTRNRMKITYCRLLEKCQFLK
jgi:hypothetical protein